MESTAYDSLCGSEGDGESILQQGKHIDEISTADCQSFIDELSNRMKSFKDYGNQLDFLFRYAKHKRIIKENPMDRVVYPYFKDEYTTEEDDKGVEFWEKETVNYFLMRAEQELAYRSVRHLPNSPLYWNPKR